MGLVYTIHYDTAVNQCCLNQLHYLSNIYEKKQQQINYKSNYTL